MLYCIILQDAIRNSSALNTERCMPCSAYLKREISMSKNNANSILK